MTDRHAIIINSGTDKIGNGYNNNSNNDNNSVSDDNSMIHNANSNNNNNNKYTKIPPICDMDLSVICEYTYT